ncbi:TetR/AcrR family transcriptional regulator [Bacillus swezeyi]|uniref:TetR family transcriptional regulator n=1 Tax=Bacillus swezeyi TaxID=1925020 RepID=A0A1R1RZU0_9BACI|nr:TetR/AcrR family transcriptional regulator [Bacillus swezeyi]MEC1259718.1 TetR/AcrR family transcriptional regulator [Bacillus swezeyi]MED2927319.1 TetR/AcrR family transcriptional regulator [Bacillus swezeyi]MED2941572.1 TetR/AcrR family transcriptional regulator [Bacillus swezeyi]MED2962517.1 TetR/AcrR family transcriptional regulator [Bacillus swezeyi]MED2977119.1 TetR/AcrR family transcriptional regulator [Bacillus swezeyi]
MPKIVDHEKQKEKIAEAVWNVIHREGLEQCTVRKIAKEAGLSAGSLRHYFPNQSELLIYSMKLVTNRVKVRIENMRFTGTPAECIKQLLLQLLPADEERRLEMEAWFSFTAKSLSDPALRPLRKEMNEEIYSACKLAVETLSRSGAMPEMDAGEEIERLYALVDGLALHALLEPERITADKIDSVLTRQLNTLK